MAISAISSFVEFCARYVTAWLEELHLANKLAAATSICVSCTAMYLGVVVSGHTRENAVQQAGAAVALYMDSFVASLVQELATKDTLSHENREALERLLSPASMHRPIVAFRIWKRDTVVFSNERNLIGKTFGPSSARERALEGQIGVEFESPDGDDDEQVRSLKVPVLEVYAPVRQKGTGRIIAIAETYELAAELTREVWIKQLATWVSAVAIVITINLLLFGMAGTGRRERDSLLGRIGVLSRLRAEGEQQRRKIAHANMKVSELNERSLRSIEADLQQGPLQNVTLALLKLDPVHWTPSDSNGVVLLNSIQCMEDIIAIREALSQTMRQMQGVCTAAVPARVADLSTSETLAAAARDHFRRSGRAVECDFDRLPEQLPLPLKVCLYRILLEGLHGTAGGTKSHQVRGSLYSNSIVLEIVGGAGGSDRRARLASVRDRIEALGGILSINSTPSGQLSLIAELNLSDMGIALA